jgi:hypothetical protein
VAFTVPSVLLITVLWHRQVQQSTGLASEPGAGRVHDFRTQTPWFVQLAVTKEQVELVREQRG